MMDPMLLARRLADVLTLGRALIAVWLAWLGLSAGQVSLPWASWLLVLAWTTDFLDGPLARRGPRKAPTSLGDHDLAIDIMVSLGVLAFLVFASYLDWPYATAYLLLWSVIFLHWGFARALGMLIQAPIYGWFLLVATQSDPTSAVRILVWITIAILISWPRFPKEIVPDFLEGMRRVMDGAHQGRYP